MVIYNTPLYLGRKTADDLIFLNGVISLLFELIVLLLWTERVDRKKSIEKNGPRHS